MSNPITKIIISAVDRTKAALASAKGGLASLAASAQSVSGLIGSLFTGLSAAVFVGQIKRAIDSMDEAYESAQRAGTSVENLTSLQFAGKQTGVQDMEKSLVALADAIDAARKGTGPAAEAFAALGIDPKQFSDPADALDALADRFSKLPDGVTKTSLAIDIFTKRIGPGMIPLLNEGAAGIKRLKDEGAALGVVLKDDVAGAANEFNDNLGKLKSGFDGLAISLVSPALPAMNEFVALLTKAAQEGGFAAAAMAALKAAGTDFLDNEELSATYRLAEAQKQLNALRADGFDEDHKRIKQLKEAVPALRALAKEEEKLAAAKAESAKKATLAAKDNEKAIEAREEEVRRFKDSVDDQVKDAERLQSALTSAYGSMLDEEQRYRDEAKRLRAQANAGALEGADQDVVEADASLAALKLSRLSGSGSPEEIREQAAAVRELAAALEDKKLKSDLVRQATLAEASAAERQADASGQQAVALADQLKANEARTAEIAKAKDEIGKPATLEINSGPGVAQAKADLKEILELLDRIGDKPLAVGTVINGAPSNMVKELRQAALQYGRRG